VRPVGEVSGDPIAHRLCFVDAPVAEGSVLNMHRFLFFYVCLTLHQSQIVRGCCCCLRVGLWWA
jgi:hypothetical protein